MSDKRTCAAPVEVWLDDSKPPKLCGEPAYRVRQSDGYALCERHFRHHMEVTR